MRGGLVWGRVWCRTLLALGLGLVLLTAGPAGVRAAAPLAAGSPADLPLPQLFDQALRASRGGDFDGALPLWEAVLA